MVDSAEKKGRKLPEWFLEKPDIPKDCLFFLKAFQTLSTGRQIGMGVGPIHWRDILEYTHLQQFDVEVTRMFITVIEIMDRAYIEDAKKQSEKK